jgi:hypothetical protein
VNHTDRTVGPLVAAHGASPDEAARLLGDASEIAAGNSSARLITALRQGCIDLRSWADTVAIRALEDRLASCGVAVKE